MHSGDGALDRTGCGGAAAPDETLPEMFSSVARALRRQSWRTLEPWNLTPSQAGALGMLDRHGRMRLSDLADHLHIAPRSATEFVDDLEIRGLVTRSPDPADRRATLASLTDAGTAAGAAIRAARQAETDRIFGTLSHDDRATLTRVLRDLRAAMEP